MSTPRLVEGTRVAFRGTIRDQDGVIVNLTGATVIFRRNIGEGATVEDPATVIDASGGRVEFLMNESQVLPGVLEYEWRGTLSTGEPFNSQDVFTELIRPRVQSPSKAIPD